MTDWGYMYPPGTRLDDIDGPEWRGADPAEAVLALPRTCPRCGARTRARLPNGVLAAAPHVEVEAFCQAGSVFTCRAALYADLDDPDDAAETCDTELGEGECWCKDCQYQDREDD